MHEKESTVTRGEETMEIIKKVEAEKLTLAIEGRLDSTTAPELDNEVQASIVGVKELVFDFDKLEYVSSAGLRVLLSAQKKMNEQGTMIVTNVADDIMGIFEVTGFVDILNIQ